MNSCFNKLLLLYLSSYGRTKRKYLFPTVPVSMNCVLPRVCSSTSRLPLKFHTRCPGNAKSETWLSKHVTLLWRLCIHWCIISQASERPENRMRKHCFSCNSYFRLHILRGTVWRYSRVQLKVYTSIWIWLIIQPLLFINEVISLLGQHTVSRLGKTMVATLFKASVSRLVCPHIPLIVANRVKLYT
jgi:hypothetical protein